FVWLLTAPSDSASRTLLYALPISFVLLLATAAARFLDRGLMLTMQAGVQAIVVVALPVQASGGPMTRWVDALIGGLMALAAAALDRKSTRLNSSHVSRPYDVFCLK